MNDVVRGQCLCGSVRFHTDRATMRDVVICHCAMCRRWHGHVGAYSNIPRTALVFDRQDDLAWFQSSDFARRGFCRVCGSRLVWEAPERPVISITAGALDNPTGLSTTLQIFAGHKGDYYELDPAVPVRPEPSPS